MDTPQSLRTRASRWRSLALRHVGELAALLHGAADEAERRADALEGRPARLGAEPQPDAGGARRASEISLKR